jgi:hypothetical protein
MSAQLAIPKPGLQHVLSVNPFCDEQLGVVNTQTCKQKQEHSPTGGGFSVQLPMTVGRKVPLAPQTAVELAPQVAVQFCPVAMPLQPGDH